MSKDTTMPLATGQAFWTNLQRSNLLPPVRLRQIQGELGAEVDPARRLVARGVLTGWQVDRLREGRTAFFLGRYKLLEPLGQGGMGAVFKAEQTPLGRTVAVKIIAETLVNDPAQIARFRREIRAAAALNHPNIVTALDAESAGQSHFLVMEFQTGKDLRTLILRQKRLPIDQACEFARQVAHGLQHAHERGMVHRDIKPGNLLLTPGRAPADCALVVKILDFGLARFAGETVEEGRLTRTGQIMGTPDYISPEQARDSRIADIRGDIYSLGCTLYRLLAGRVPFLGQNAIERITARLISDPPPLQNFRRDVPDELARIVQRALARDPRERYQHPADLAEALAPFAAPSSMEETVAWLNEPDSDLPPGVRKDDAAGDRLPTRKSRANPVTNARLDQFLRDLDHEADADESFSLGVQEETVLERVAAPTIIAPSGRHLVNGGRKLQQEMAQKKQVDRKRLLAVLAGLLIVGGLLAGSFAWQRASRTLLVVNWPADQRTDGTIVVDGRKVKLSAEGSLQFPGPPGRRTLRLARAGYEPVEVAWRFAKGEQKFFQPDWVPEPETARGNQWKALQADVTALNARLQENGGRQPSGSAAEISTLIDRIAVYRARWFEVEGIVRDSARLRARLLTPADALRREDIPPEQLKLAGQGDPNRAPYELVAVLGDARLRHWNDISDVAFSPDGKTLGSASYDGTVILWDAETGQLLHRFSENHSFHALEFSPDGKRLAAGYGAAGYGGGGSGGVILWDLATRTVRRHLPHPNIKDIGFSPDGQLLASASYDEKNLRLWNANTGTLRYVLGGQMGSPMSISFSPDGKTVASACRDGMINLWNVDDGTLRRSFPYPETETIVASIAFHPDGTLLASAGNDAIVRFWALATGQERRALAIAAYHVTFSPDGQTLATAHDDVWFCETATGRQIARISRSQLGSRPTCLTYSPDGTKLAIGCANGAVQLWDVKTLRPVIARSPEFTTAVISPDGRLLAAGDETGRLTLYDLATLDVLRTWQSDSRRVTALAFSSDASLLAAGHSDGGENLRMWETSTGRLRYTLHGHQFSVSSLAFTPDGALLASCSDYAAAGRSLRVWNTATGERVHAFDQPEFHDLVLSPDGKTLFALSDQPKEAIWFLDLATGRKPGALTFGNGTLSTPMQLAVSPNGRLLAQNHGGKLQFWNVRTVLYAGTGAEPLWSVRIGVGINDLTFSPDGTTLVAATDEAQVKLWGVPQDEKQWRQFNFSQQRTLQLGPPGGYVREIHYTPDGRHLVTVNGNGSIYVLRLRPWPPIADTDFSFGATRSILRASIAGPANAPP